MTNLLYENCNLCPRNCAANRTSGEKGMCGESSELRVAHIGAHFGEEPSFTGIFGSGTIFFSGCSCQCFFCQNRQISAEHYGKIYSSEQFLLEIEKLIVESKVHNLNFVTPDHFWRHIKNLCRELREKKITILKIFNSSGYQKKEMILEYASEMDIFLSDFKFADSELARTCMGDERYPEIAFEAVKLMIREKGFLKPFDETGERLAQTGVLVRHLVLPGFVENSLNALELLHKEFGNDLPISMMAQFSPMPRCRQSGILTRRLNVQEYESVLEKVESLGFKNVYIQELRDETSFLPDFSDPQNPFKGNKNKSTHEE